jgi:hypothetical protein
MSIVKDFDEEEKPKREESSYRAHLYLDLKESSRRHAFEMYEQQLTLLHYRLLIPNPDDRRALLESQKKTWDKKVKTFEDNLYRMTNQILMQLKQHIQVPQTLDYHWDIRHGFLYVTSFLYELRHHVTGRISENTERFPSHVTLMLDD